MPKQPIPYAPVGGISFGEAPHRIGETQVQNAANWCFDGRRAWTRAGLKTTAITGTGLTTVRLGGDFKSDGLPYRFIITTGNKLFSVTTAGVATEITGAGFTMASNSNNDTWALVNTELMIGNCTSGFIRWTPGAGTYSLVGGATYSYITSHFSRGVAANNGPAGGGSYRQIAWAVPGNNADWTTTIDGAGSVILTDAADDITGLANIKNTLVVVRRNGFHLGYSTGVAQPAFRFEMASRSDVGCTRIGSLAQTADYVYFISQDNVYRYDANRVEAVGDDIKALLFPAISTAAKVVGFMSRRFQIGEPPRFTYNLVMVFGATTTSSAQLRHFCLDIDKQIWECHEYGSQWNYAWETIPSTQTSSIGFIDQSTSPTLSEWDPTVACERATILHGRNITVGGESDDVTLDQALIKYQDRGAANVSLLVRCDLNETEIERLVSFQAGTPERRGKWSRKNINGLRQTGQGWEWIIKTEPGSALGLSDIIGMFSLSGKFRGE